MKTIISAKIPSEKFLVEQLLNQTFQVVQRLYIENRGWVYAAQVVRVCENVSNPKLHDAMLHYAAHHLGDVKGNIPPDFQELLNGGSPIVVQLVETLVGFVKSYHPFYCKCNYMNSGIYHSHQTTPKCSLPDLRTNSGSSGDSGETRA